MVIKNCKRKKSPGPEGFTGEFHQAFKDIIPVLKLFQKTEEEETVCNSFCKANITLLPKSHENNTKKRKLDATISNKHRCKNIQQNTNQIQQNIRMNIHHY